jgi:hypothetical protein
MNKHLTKKHKEIICYASSLGNCSKVQSNEHYISQHFFTNNLITIEGKSWLNGKAKTLSYKKAGGLRILCETHNKMLGPIDGIVSNYAHKIRELINKSQERSNLSRASIWKKDVFEINGAIFEQWMIKAALGAIFETNNLNWHQDNLKPNNPPIDILKAQFGLTKLEYPMGIYQTTEVGKLIENEERASVTLLNHKKSKGYLGSLVNFLNFKFIIWLHNEPPIDSITSNEVVILDENNALRHHPPEWSFCAKGKISSIVKFNWEKEPMKLL